LREKKNAVRKKKTQKRKGNINAIAKKAAIEGKKLPAPGGTREEGWCRDPKGKNESLLEENKGRKGKKRTNAAS